VTAVSPAPVVFGQPIPALSAAITGFVLGDTQGVVVTGTPAVSTTATPYSVPGSYPITAALGMLQTNANYTFAFVNGALTVQATGAAPPSGTACNGAYTGAFQGNLTVSAGQVCMIDGGKVTGNVTSNGGIVRLYGATVTGNLTISGTATGSGASLTHQICASSVQGDVQFQNDVNSLAAGGGQACLNTIGGNLQVHNNTLAATLALTYNKVTGNIQVQSNAGPVTVSNNSSGNDTQVTGNTAAVTVNGNAVGGNLQIQNNTVSNQVFNNVVTNNLQCSGDANITGGGNTAKSKQGQCGGF